MDSDSKDANRWAIMRIGRFRRWIRVKRHKKHKSLQADNSRLDCRPEDEGLPANKARLGDAIKKIEVRLQPALSWFGVIATCNE